MKLNESDQLLKDFLEEHIPFYELRKVGFFPKTMKKSDIHGQAKRICQFFGYETVFEYGAKTTYAHISYVEGHRPSWVNEMGEYEQTHFVEKFGGIYE